VLTVGVPARGPLVRQLPHDDDDAVAAEQRGGTRV